MTTDLTPYEPTTAVAAITSYQDAAVRRLADWAHSAEAAHSIAATLVQTSFCPDSFRNKPGEATAAILAGLEVGLQPMAALRSFDVIQGQAAPRALTLRAIVQSFGHEMVMEESTATRCRMRGRRRGASEWTSVTWTIDRAKDLGLVGKQNWRQQPQAMLIARATSELARLVAADAILGLGYSAEEVADGTSGDVPVAVTPDAQGPTTTGRRILSRPKPAEPEPPAEDVQDAEVEPEPTPADVEESGDGITSGQLKKIGAGMRDVGIVARPDALAYVARVIGREVESRNDLTKAEAHQVIEALEFDAMGAEPAEEPS